MELFQYTRKAEFGRSQRGKLTLVVDGYIYIQDTQSRHKQTWRCSKFLKYKCKARAATRIFHGVERVHVTNPYHCH